MTTVYCTSCDEPLERLAYQIKASKTGNFFCDRSCRSKWDAIKFKDNRVDFTCPVCGIKERVTPSSLRDKKFCSLKCLAEQRSQDGNTEVTCNHCDNKFIKLNAKIADRNFCSKKCSNDWTSENLNTQVGIECIICQSNFMVGRNRKDLAKTCSKKCHGKHIRILSQGEMKEHYRRNGLTTASRNIVKDTLPEIMVKGFLEDEGILFEPQKPMYDKFLVDFYLPEYDLVIEVHGDYWHCNPLFYGYEEGKKEPNEFQLKQMKKDKSRKGYLEKCGHKFAVAWEVDIYNDTKNIIKSIINQNP